MLHALTRLSICKSVIWTAHVIHAYMCFSPNFWHLQVAVARVFKALFLARSALGLAMTADVKQHVSFKLSKEELLRAAALALSRTLTRQGW